MSTQGAQGSYLNYHLDVLSLGFLKILEALMALTILKRETWGGPFQWVREHIKFWNKYYDLNQLLKALWYLWYKRLNNH